jgi:hypothetical protein
LFPSFPCGGGIDPTTFEEERGQGRAEEVEVGAIFEAADVG